MYHVYHSCKELDDCLYTYVRKLAGHNRWFSDIMCECGLCGSHSGNARELGDGGGGTDGGVKIGYSQ